MHLTKNLRSKIVTEDTGDVVRQFSFFINMQKNQNLPLVQDKSITKEVFSKTKMKEVLTWVSENAWKSDYGSMNDSYPREIFTIENA